MNKSRDNRARFGTGRKWLPAIIVAAGVLAYLNSFSGAFVFDDSRTIVQQQQIRQLWPVWECLAGSRRPTVRLSLAVNHAIGELNPGGYHAFNLAVHLLAGVTLFGVVRRTLLRERLRAAYGQAAPWLALTVALIWVVHPLQTQSVTYVIQRSESMMGLFYLLTVYCVIRGVESSRPRAWYAAAVAACGLGMGSKAVMVTAPVVVLLYDRIFLAGSWAAALRRRRGLYAGLAATWSILVACGVAQAVLIPSAAGRVTVGFGYKGVAPLEYMVTQPGVILHYLRLSFWPHALCLDYGWPVARTAGAIVGPGLVLLALLVGTVWALFRRPGLGFVGAWFFLILAPTSSVIPIKDLAFEHRMYLPLAAVIALSTIGGWSVVNSLLTRFSLRRASQPLVGGGLVVAVAAGLGYATTQRNKDYRTAAGIWEDVLKTRPDNPRAWNNLGVALLRSGRSDQAKIHYREALRLKPDYAEAHHNLGAALEDQGQVEQAIPCYREALRLKPNYVYALCRLGNALMTLGRHDEAFGYLQRAVALRPDYADARVGLGSALARAGRVEEAIRHYGHALELQPENAVCLNNLGDALARQGKTAEALERYRAALGVDPDYHPAHNNLGNALVTLGRYEEAFEHFHRALALEPESADAHVSLGYALAQTGRLDEAIDHYRRALERQPRNVLCLNNLGNALLNQNKIEQADAAFREALAIDPRRADTYSNLGNVLVRAGDPAGGVECYRKAIALAPDLLSAHYNLAETYRRMERTEEAKTQYRRALALAERAGNTAIAQRIRQKISSLE